MNESVVKEKVLFDKIEQSIAKSYTRPIRLVPLKKKRDESLEQFLVKFFTSWNDEKETIYVDSREVQTVTGKRRSLGDIYMICKYYYPKCTVAEILNLLYFRLPNSISKGFRTSHCYRISKRVWYYDENMSNGHYNKDEKDEYGHAFRYYKERLGKTLNDEDDYDG